MKKFFFICLVLGLGPGNLDAAKADELAGEQEPAKALEKKPDFAEPEGAGQISLTRSAKASQMPNFELPEAVVTGSGERKAVSKRPELSTMMDTSGGIKASPSEQNASKDQFGAVGTRQAFENLTESSRPAYGQVRALYGLANTFDVSAFWGEQRGSFYYLLEADHDFSDGGPYSPALAQINQGKQTGLFAHAGWLQDSGQQWSAQASARWRDRLWTRSTIPDPKLSRWLYDAGLAYQGAPQAAVKHTIKLSASQAQAIFPGQGIVYTEGLAGISVDLEKEFLTRLSRTLLLGSFYARQLDQNQGAETSWLAGGWFMARLEPWSGARLGIGLNLDSVSSQSDGFLLSPRAEFEQRLGKGLSAWARFAPRMELPTFTDTLFEKDPAFAGLPILAPKDKVNFEGGFSASLKGNIGLELKGFVRQNEQAVQLDDPLGTGLWRQVNVRGLQVAGGSLSESSPLAENTREHLSVSYQSSELTDSPGLAATFAPALSGEAGLDWAKNEWKAGAALLFVGERQGRLAGGDPLAAYVDLRLSGEYAYNERLSFLISAGNLLSQPVQEFSGYTEPAPYLGLGAQYQF